jgi:hypothetical protein
MVLVVDRTCPFACCDGFDWRYGGQDVRDGLELQTRMYHGPSTK